MTEAVLLFKPPGQRLARWVAGLSVVWAVLVVAYVLIFERPGWLMLSALGVLSSGIGAWQRLAMSTQVRSGSVTIRDANLRRRQFDGAEIIDIAAKAADGPVEMSLRSRKALILPGVQDRDLVEILGLLKPGSAAD